MVQLGLCIDRVEGSFPIRALTHEVGMCVLLGIGAVSSTLLTFSPEKEREAIVESNQRKGERSFCGLSLILSNSSSCWILFRNLNQKEAFP